MRSYDPLDKNDVEEAFNLNAEQWQLDTLKVNPSYTYWGPHEDAMMKDPRYEHSWSNPMFFDDWEAFKGFRLDELNEVVNFYFSVERERKQCHTCEGDGYHPKSHSVTRTFYSHMNPAGENWDDKITQDEVQALVDAGRLMDLTHTWNTEQGWQRKDPPHMPTAEEVNALQHKSAFASHDCINRHILNKVRCERLGLPLYCPECNGSGYMYIVPKAELYLTLWLLHPRKGCSRGIEIKNLTQADLPAAQAFLKVAAKRNAERFSNLGLIA